MSSAKVAEFWGGAINSFLTETELEAPAENLEVGRLVKFGQKIHCLELIACLGERGQLPRGLPEELLERSRLQRRRTAAFNRVLKETAVRINSRSSDRSLAWLKSSRFLLDEVHPVGLRRMSDLDLLVRKQDLSYWDQVFRSLEFKPHRDVNWITSEDFSPYVSSTRYCRAADGVNLLLDVHWHLVDFSPRRSCGRWDFSMKQVWQAVEGRRLKPEHSFLYTVDHLFTHSFRLWKAYLDLAHLQDEYSLDREFMSRQASRFNILEIYQMSTDLARRLFGMKLPELEESVGSAKNYREHHDQFVREVVGGDLKHGEYLWICVHDIPGYLEKLIFCLNVLFPAPSEISRLPGRPAWPVLVGGYVRRSFKVIVKVLSYLLAKIFG